METSTCKITSSSVSLLKNDPESLRKMTTGYVLRYIYDTIQTLNMTLAMISIFTKLHLLLKLCDSQNKKKLTSSP